MRTLKKYPNRRLYDTQESRFVTLEDVKQLVLHHENFTVEDSKTGSDLTSGVLLQIIIEMEEAGGETLLTNKVLQQLIRFYGSGMQGLLSQYLEQSIGTFLDQQENIQRQMRQLIDANPMNILASMSDNQFNFMKAFGKNADEKADSDKGAKGSKGTKDS